MSESEADDDLRVDALVLQVAASEPDDRERLLDDVSREDPDLAAEARRRLAEAEAIPTSFLATIAAGPCTDAAADGDVAQRRAQQPPPETLGPYRVLRRLGEGGMGEVYEGYDDRLDRPVALKRILPHSEDHEQARARFRREARAEARLSHSAIVQVHDWVETDDNDWIVMELVDGRSLSDILAAGPLAPEHAARLARDVAAGLAAAHEAGIVHRDLKPSNVMVTGGQAADGRAKILDFGIATFSPSASQVPVTTVTAEGKIVGSVTAMSPEQAMGRRIDHRSDLFALGVLLYEMTTGETPFQGESLVEILVQICSVRQPPAHEVNPAIPMVLSELIDRLLEKDPQLRPPDANDVVGTLERWLVERSRPRLEAVETSTRTHEAEAAMPPPAAPRRWGPTVAAILGLVLLAVVLTSYVGRTPAPLAASGSAEGTAEETAKNAAEIDPYRLYQQGLEDLARYDQEGNLDRATKTFQRLLARDPNSAIAYAGLAKAYWLQHFSGSRDPQWLTQALAAAQNAVRLDEYLAVARVSLGFVLADLGRPGEAVEEFEKGLQLEPLNADAHYGLGRIDESEGDLEAAESSYRRAIELAPESWIYPTRLGRLYYRSSRYEEAEALFLAGTELAPDNFFSYRNLGAVYYMQDKLGEAATQFQKALQIRSDASLYMNLGTIYFAQGLYQQSVAVFEKALETGTATNNYRSWGNLADAYRWTPDNEEKARDAYLRAIQLLEERLRATPEDATLHSRLALFLAKRGDCEQALASVATATSLGGLDTSSRYRLAVAHELCGQRTQALDEIETALADGYSLPEVRRDPELMDLRRDQRFHRLIMRQP